MWQSSEIKRWDDTTIFYYYIVICCLTLWYRLVRNVWK